MTNTMTNHIDLYYELEEEMVRGKFNEESNFNKSKRKKESKVFYNVTAIFKVDLFYERFVNIYIESSKNLEFV